MLESKPAVEQAAANLTKYSIVVFQQHHCPLIMHIESFILSKLAMQIKIQSHRYNQHRLLYLALQLSTPNTLKQQSFARIMLNSIAV